MTRDHSRHIAITGVSARFPGPSDIHEWWAAVQEGRVLTTRYERDSLLAAGVPEELVDEPDYVPVHGHLADAERFDNELFRISPREAEMTDPQHRLMLEAVWAAFEDAGMAPLNGVSRTAVYASSAPSGYLRRMLVRGLSDPLSQEDALHGNEPDFMASRIAYKLALIGPAVGVQCACSSSLVAVHMAVRALLDGECDQAAVVAAAVAFPQGGYLHVPGGVLSASGNCRPFDAAADGTVAGSGVACVVLRRLADALESGPQPHAVIIGTATNNDGSAKAGYYAPSVSGQEAVITAALQAAEVDGESIGYLETHGTGTHLGDPIEWTAASSALRSLGARPGQVAIGAAKANIGHLDAAAGIANLVKALLVVSEGVVPQLAGFVEPNPLLEADRSPLFVPTESRLWMGPEPRRAGISSFGIGGTNAHVVIEQAPGRPAVPRRDERSRLLLLSAGDPAALSRASGRLSDCLAGMDSDIADVSHTLATGRTALPERLALTAKNASEAAERLAAGAGIVRSRASSGPAVFVFPGQGAQYPGMATPFAEAIPGFEEALASCLEAFDDDLAGRMNRALWQSAFAVEELEATELAQPVLFALEHAAAQALRGLGVQPAAVAGHSLGELTAACVAGILDLFDAARLVTARGRAMGRCSPGAMLALGCDEVTARQLVAGSGGGLEVAAVNSPQTCVVAGTIPAVEAFESQLGDTIFSKRLRTSRAFHSVLIEPALPRLEAELADMRFNAAETPLVTSATGRLVPSGATIDRNHFVEQARRPVRFADTVETIARSSELAVVVEVGPGATLSGMFDGRDVTTIPLSAVRNPRSRDAILTALGHLWTLGQPISPAALVRGGDLVHLPTYAFRGPKWIAPEAMQAPPVATTVDEVDATPVDESAPSGHEEPEISSLMVSLWQELLGYADIDQRSDFFQLGGDSLLITHLAHRIHQALGVRVPIRDMVSVRTLGRQIEVVTSARLNSVASESSAVDVPISRP